MSVEHTQDEPDTIASPEERAFIEAIAEQPKEDASPLMYADWLSDQGHVLGDFIRVDTQLDSLLLQGKHNHLELVKLGLIEEVERLQEERLRLWKNHQEEILRLVPHRLRSQYRYPLELQINDKHVPAIVRGLPRRIEMNDKEVKEYGNVVFRQLPIQELTLRIRNTETLQDILSLPQAKNLRVLTLIVDQNPDDFAHIVASAPSLSSLKTLDLGTTHHLSRNGYEALLSSKTLPSTLTLRVRVPEPDGDLSDRLSKRFHLELIQNHRAEDIGDEVILDPTEHIPGATRRDIGETLGAA